MSSRVGSTLMVDELIDESCRSGGCRMGTIRSPLSGLSPPPPPPSHQVDDVDTLGHVGSEPGRCGLVAGDGWLGTSAVRGEEGAEARMQGWAEAVGCRGNKAERPERTAGGRGLGGGGAGPGEGKEGRQDEQQAAKKVGWGQGEAT